MITLFEGSVTVKLNDGSDEQIELQAYDIDGVDEFHWGIKWDAHYDTVEELIACLDDVKRALAEIQESIQFAEDN